MGTSATSAIRVTSEHAMMSMNITRQEAFKVLRRFEVDARNYFQRCSLMDVRCTDNTWTRYKKGKYRVIFSTSQRGDIDVKAILDRAEDTYDVIETIYKGSQG